MAKKLPKLPKTLGACADRLYELRTEIAALNKQAESLKAERFLIEEHLINNLPKEDARGVSGVQAKANIVTKTVASVKDWDKLYKYILKTKDFSLLKKSVADSSVKERWEAKKAVPGVEPFNVVKVSVNKV